MKLDKLNAKMFEDALNKCVDNIDDLDTGERRFVNQMRDAWNMVGTDFEPSVRQFNWLRQIAQDFR